MPESKTQKSVGAVLKEARLAKKADLGAASSATKIHVRILTAMEEDAFESLGSVYAKGFLKIYAEYLGLDKEALVREAFPVVGAAKAVGFQKNRTAVSTAEKPKITATSLLSKPMLPAPRPVVFSFRAAIILIALIAFSFGAKRVIVGMVGRPAASKKEAVEKKEGKKISSAKPPVGAAKKAASRVIEIPKNSASASAEPKTSAAEAKLVLVARAKNKTWLQVKSDGRIVFQTVLPKGAAESWQAREKLELWVGDAGGLELEFNGRLLGKIGRPGQILRRVILTKNGLSIQK